MTLARRLTAEFLGSAGLLIAVVGSGIMAESLAGGNLAVVLLANSIATGAALYALILCFAPISGAHFNPAVSLVECLWKKLTPRDFGFYCLAQISGACAGVAATHAMFGQLLVQLSTRSRDGGRFLISEMIATFGLLLTISLAGKRSVEATPLAVALYVVAAYWCTSSTSFANPAVTIARCFTDTFTGIQWSGAPGFIAAELTGALLAFVVSRKLSSDPLSL